MQVETVVERADDRDDRGAEQYAVPQIALAGVAGRQPDQPRDDPSRQDREASEKRRRAVGQATPARFVDRADGPREPHRQRCQQGGHRRGGQERVERFELGWLRHRLRPTACHAGVASDRRGRVADARSRRGRPARMARRRSGSAPRSRSPALRARSPWTRIPASARPRGSCRPR